MGLLTEFFMLPYEIHAPDMVVWEIEQSPQFASIAEFIRMDKLKVDQVVSEDMPEVLKLLKGNLSITDCAVWFQAKKQAAVLLTGDRRLRRLAEADGVVVAGILFVLDCIVEFGSISAGYAAECLETLKGHNNRLPSEEVDSRLKSWTQIFKEKEGDIM